MLPNNTPNNPPPSRQKALSRRTLEKKSKAELIDTLLELQQATALPEDTLRNELDRVYEALDTISEPVALFDADDRFVFVNQAYRGVNAAIVKSTRKGEKFEDHLKNLLSKGLVAAAKGRETGWFRDRMDKHQAPVTPFDQVRTDGTELRVTEQKLSDGSTFLISENISAEKKADKALAESEYARDVLSMAIDEISEGIAIFDDEDRLVLGNKSWWHMMGAVAEITHAGITFEKHLWNCLNAGLIPQANEGPEEWVAWRLARHKSPEKPFEIALGGGRVNLVHEQVLTDGGRILVILNITEQKRLQTRLEEAVESINEAFVLFDAEGKLVLSNSKFKELFPPLADLLTPGVSFETLFRASVSSGQHTGKTSADEDFIQSRLKDFYKGEGTKERHLSDGRWIMVSDRKTRSGEIVGVRTDITELKRREEEASQAGQMLLDAIESISDGFILFDANERMLLCNSKYEEYYSVIKDILRPGVTYQELVAKTLERKGVQAKTTDLDDWKQRRLSQFRSAQGMHQEKLPDGRTIQLTERRTKMGGIVGIRTEITDIVKAENESRKALVAAERANRAKSEFLGNMSHELRTPLNAIIGFSSIISREMYGPINNVSYREYAADIHSSGEHLLTLIGDLLDISKIESGTLTLQKTGLDSDLIIRECLRMVEGQCRKKQISIQTEMAPDLPQIYADGRHFRQILLNILSNAVKFTLAQGQIKISTQLRATDDCVIILIADTGIGIASENIASVLEPFGQVADSSTRNHDGVGLGLAIVKSLVELHDGELRVHSAFGEGTTIEIAMPIFPKVG